MKQTYLGKNVNWYFTSRPKSAIKASVEMSSVEMSHT